VSGTVDYASVSLMSTYRVGFQPPAVSSLKAGELYVEVDPAVGGAPRLWVGTPSHIGYAGNNALLVSQTVPPAASAITIAAIANPSPSNAVAVSGTVAPGALLELAAMTGTNLDYLTQVTGWSPWDATAGTFSMTWYLPPGDNYRIRARMHHRPQTYTDSNLFAVFEPPRP
jgi:hypothetical protein